MNNSEQFFVRRGETIHETNAWTHNEWLCRPGLAGSGKLMMVRATMKSGHCHPFHVHPHREEIIHVVSGKAEQWVGSFYQILEPGEIAVVPPGVPHGTFNPFDENLVFHAILSPAELDATAAGDEDPLDVSLLEPWKSIRAGRPECRVMGT